MERSSAARWARGQSSGTIRTPFANHSSIAVMTSPAGSPVSRLTVSSTSAAFNAQIAWLAFGSASRRPLANPPGSPSRTATSGAASKMAIASFLALRFFLAFNAFQVVAREAMLALEHSERRGEHVVRDRLERDVVAVVDEPDARDTPAAADVRRDRDLSAGRDLHGRHALHHIAAV